jgi:hypothetical protein
MGSLPHPELDMFRSRHRPYYIATGVYIRQSMGFRAPFQLCHALNELGYEAYVTAKEPVPDLRAPALTPEIIARHKVQGRETVAVYTEAMWGNVLRGDIVVRWMLNKIGLKASPEDHPGELFFYWSQEYAPAPAFCRLQFPFVDRGIFRTKPHESGGRKGFAYYASKYTKYSGHPVSEEAVSGGISLCLDIPRTQQEIAGILRSVKHLVSYEESSLLTEAAYCGCERILVNTPFVAHLLEADVAHLFEYCIDECDIKSALKAESMRGFSKRSYETENLEDKVREPSLDSIADFCETTQNQDPCAMDDEFFDYCRSKGSLYIFGAGFTSETVCNAVLSAGFGVLGFVVSDEYFSGSQNTHRGLPVRPLSCFANQTAKRGENTGLILAVLHECLAEILPGLEAANIDYYNPVLY